MMLETLNPEYRFSSLVKITPEWMRRHQYRVLLMDIDNTLLPRNSCVVPDRHMDWLQEMQRQGIVMVLASNNGGERVAAIERQLSEEGLRIPVLTWAGKPFPRAYAGALRLLEESFPAMGFEVTNRYGRISGSDKAEGYGSETAAAGAEPAGHILAAGDQMFTDILGAHWYNLPVVWLRPLSENDFIGTKVLRFLEKRVARRLMRQGILPEEDRE